MADIELIIKINEKHYEHIKNLGALWIKDKGLSIISKALLNGTPLPQETKTGHWIPVSERLPEIHQDVFLSLRSLDIEIGFRAETEPYFYCHGGAYIEPQNVIAWMPFLLEPYKIESERKNDR